MNQPVKGQWALGSRCRELVLPTLPCGVGRSRSQADLSFALDGWRATLSTSFSDVSALWPDAPDNRFLSPAYLRTLEAGMAQALCPRFLVLEDAEGPFAWMLLQTVRFDALEDIRDPEVWSGTFGALKRLAARLGRFEVLVCGNVLAPGLHGWMTREGCEDRLRTRLGFLLRRVARRIGASVVLCKDLPEALPVGSGLHALHFQPNMVMELRPEWAAFDDYLMDMHSKYRIRARRAFKKGASIRYRELSAVQTALLAPTLTEMYQQVVRHSGFSLAEAGAAYFIELKDRLGPHCSFTACYEEEQLCGFYTTICNGDTLEAHCVGFRQELNRSAQLYLNMLYRMVQEGIEKDMRRIVFGRTALEIKSSVGAVPKPALVYMAHVNPLLHRLLPAAVRFLEPREEWVQRHPFLHSL